MDPKEELPKAHVIEVKIPEGAQTSLAELLKQEIDQCTDLIEKAEYLLIKFEHFWAKPKS
jgi:hypothetical protein